MIRECKDCGQAFETDSLQRKLCPDCGGGTRNGIGSSLYQDVGGAFKKSVVQAPYKRRISHASRA